MIGIIKCVDRQGRIVIPKPLRRHFGIEERAEIIVTMDGVLLRKPDDAGNAHVNKQKEETDG